MKRRNAVRLMSFLFALLIVAGGLYIKELNKNRRLEAELQNDYARTLSELNSRLNSISLILEKTEYVSAAPQMSGFAAELYSEAQLAKTALAQLPSGEGSLDTVNRFLSQVGNYALSVSKSIIVGNEMTAAQKQSMALLSETAKTVSQAISDINIEINNGENWAQVIGSQLEGTVSEGALASNLTELEENITDYPTLLYDGPFSDHILTKSPLMLENAPAVERTAALETAKKLTGDTALKFDQNENGRIAAYRFVSDATTVSISQKGGYAVYFRKNRAVGDTVFSYEQALQRAKSFMKQNGFSNMTDTYYFSDEGVVCISFAYLDGQTVCYTDLIKVGVALDTGEIMLFEASGYLFNHTDRAFSTPAYTSEQAAETISDSLKIQQTSIALIPTSGGGEVRCWEFLCSGADEHEILVYVNVQSLVSEQIFILLKTDGGTLVK